MFCISIILVSNPLNFLEVKLKEMGMCSWESGSKPLWGLLKTAVIFSSFQVFQVQEKKVSFEIVNFSILLLQSCILCTFN